MSLFVVKRSFFFSFSSFSHIEKKKNTQIHKMVELVGGGFDINWATPSSFLHFLYGLIA